VYYVDVEFQKQTSEQAKKLKLKPEWGGYTDTHTHRHTDTQTHTHTHTHTVAKRWEQLKCPLTDEWISKCGIYI